MRRRRGRPPKLSDDCKWVTNWPHGPGGKWGRCEPALAAQIAADPKGMCQVMLVSGSIKLSRIILHTPEWSQTLRKQNKALEVALRLSPLDRFRAAQRANQAA